MRRRSPLVLGVLLVALGAWFLLRPTPSVVPPVDVPPPAQKLPVGAGLSTPRGGVFPSASLVPAVTRPCVKGRVVNGVSGSAVAGAQVVWATARGATTTTTDGDGAFSLDVEEGGVALAEVSASGFFPVRPLWGFFPLSFVVHPGTCVSDVRLSLTPRVEYRGFVQGPDGEPVGGAYITIATEDEAPGAPRESAADGTFTFFARDGAIVVARHPRFAPASAVVDFRVAVTGELVLRFARRGADAGLERAVLSGVVLDERDAGVPGAQVKALRRVGEEGFQRLEGVTESGAEGVFSLEVEGPAPWTVVAHVPGNVSASAVTEGAPVELRLVAGVAVAGRVVDERGQPVPSFSLLVSHEAGPLEVDREEVRHFVDAEGRFEVKGLAPGPTRVVAASLGYAPSEVRRVVLSPGAAVEVELRLRAGARVTGQVVDRATKAPLEGARVSLEGESDETLAVTPSARTGADGRFSLLGLEAGPRSLFFAASGHHARLVSVTLKDGETAGPLTVDLGAVEDGGAPQLELVGIGAVLKAEGDALVVQQVVPGGGAAEVGLVAGDAILAIDGEAAAKLGFAGGIERIRGPEGTLVRLEVRRADGAVVRLEVPRRRISR
ncbi:MAG: carboxypeptidase regulatory-like domain-containing protein [Myxococcota bacterium]